MKASSRVSPSDEPHRVRRTITACAACRDRRVKCDRRRPTCSQCSKRKHPCYYPIDDAVQAAADDHCVPDQAETWHSLLREQDVLGQQMALGDGRPFNTTLRLLLGPESPTGAHKRLAEEESLADCVLNIETLGTDYCASLASELPPREACDDLLYSFIYSIHPIVPICHIPTLQLQYARFWTTPVPSMDAESLVLILAVLYTGATNSSNLVSNSYSRPLRALFEGIFRIIDFTNFYPTMASIQLLQGYVIFNSFRSGLQAPYLAWSYLPQVIRFAQSLRLHVEQSSTVTVWLEIRRRLWWHLVYLDVEASFANGIPFILRSDTYTTQLPAVYQDEVIPEEVTETKKTLPVSPMMVAMRGHWEWAHMINTVFERGGGDAEVQCYIQTIEKAIETLPKNHPDNEWTRTYLKLLVHRAYCILGLRFWQITAFENTSCDSELIQTARLFMQGYCQLCTLCVPRSLAWFAPGLIQPLHAITILLYHLSTCSSSAAESLTSRPLLDRVFTLRRSWILAGHILERRIATTYPFNTRAGSPAQAQRHSTDSPASILSPSSSNSFPSDNKPVGQTPPLPNMQAPTPNLVALATAKNAHDSPKRVNPRYRVIGRLRRQVWHRHGWPLQLVDALVRAGDLDEVVNRLPGGEVPAGMFETLDLNSTGADASTSIPDNSRMISSEVALAELAQRMLYAKPDGAGENDLAIDAISDGVSSRNVAVNGNSNGSQLSIQAARKTAQQLQSSVLSMMAGEGIDEGAWSHALLPDGSDASLAGAMSMDMGMGTGTAMGPLGTVQMEVDVDGTGVPAGPAGCNGNGQEHAAGLGAWAT